MAPKANLVPIPWPHESFRKLVNNGHPILQNSRRLIRQTSDTAAASSAPSPGIATPVRKPRTTTMPSKFRTAALAQESEKNLVRKNKITAKKRSLIMCIYSMTLIICGGWSGFPFLG